MGTSSRIATLLDAAMLVANHVGIYPHSVPWSQIEEEQGAKGVDVSAQVGPRYLIHYIQRRDVGHFARGRGGRVYVTPTPYSPEETISWLSLPFPTAFREFALFLNPKRLGYKDAGPLCRVYGPRWVPFGGGIEYLLLDGFTEDAVVAVADDPPGPAGRWELEVK